ncbi:VWD domain-containing protein [Halorubrum sp. RMP-47]|uniref:VWD domain-containing protein n=1 Tax=Halorubrum miltondacostae TaxID=3076378 RepID=A0ABD5M4N2_9EURY
MTNRREQAWAIFFAVVMVLSMVAGSVAFGGLAAATEGATESTTADSLNANTAHSNPTTSTDTTSEATRDLASNADSEPRKNDTERSLGFSATSDGSDGGSLSTADSDDSYTGDTRVSVTAIPTGASFEANGTMEIFVGAFNDTDPPSVIAGESLNVTVEAPDGTAEEFTATTGEDGRASVEYDLEDAPSGTYEVTVDRANGEASATINPVVGPRIQPAEREFENVPTGEESDLDFLVRNGEFGQANESVTVTITAPNGTVIDERLAETDADGFLTVPVTPREPGRYEATAELDRTGATTTHGVRARELVFRSSLFDLQNALADERSSYGGYLIDGNGPVANTEVIVEFTPDGNDTVIANETAVTGENGFFSVDYVPEDVDSLDVDIRTTDGTQILENDYLNVEDPTPGDDETDDGDAPSDGSVELSVEPRSYTVEPGSNLTFDVEATQNGSAIANEAVTVFARVDYNGVPLADRTVTTNETGNAVVSIPTTNAIDGANIDGSATMTHDGTTVSESLFADIQKYEIDLEGGYGSVAGETTEFRGEAERTGDGSGAGDVPIQYNALENGDDVDSYATGEIVTNETGTGAETVSVPRDIAPYNAYTSANRYDDPGGYIVNVFDLPGSVEVVGDSVVAPGENVTLNFTTPDGTEASGLAFAGFEHENPDTFAEGNGIGRISTNADGEIPVPEYAANDSFVSATVWAADDDGNFYTADADFEVVGNGTEGPDDGPDGGGGAGGGPFVNATASSVSPTSVESGATESYEVEVVVENTTLANDSGEVDVRFDGFSLGGTSDGDTNETEDDLTIDYSADDVTNGTLAVSGTVSATAPNTSGERTVAVTDLRLDTDTDEEYLIADANATIGGIEVLADDAGPVDVALSELAGNGTEDAPYVVTNASELRTIEDDLDANYTLGNDIDASSTSEWHNGSGFRPIGTSGSFDGTLEGAGHAITGLHVDRPETDFMGLFRFVSGSVHDLTLDSVSIRGDIRTGGLAGRNTGTIENASVSGSVNGRTDIGGLVGFNAGTIDGSSTSVQVEGSEGTIGGLVGLNYPGGRISDSSASGTVRGTANVGGLVGFNDAEITRTVATVDVNGTDRVGGLVGLTQGTVRYATADSSVNGSAGVGGLAGTVGGQGTIEYASASSTVTGSTRVGGLVGENGNVVRQTFATGTVADSSDSGGLVGNNTKYRDTGTVTSSYWDEESTGQATSAGNGTGLTTAQMTGTAAADNMTGLDFETVWQVDLEGYPTLVWQGESERISIPFEATFDEGLEGWTVNHRFRTGDERDGSPTPGDGGFSTEYGGSVRLHVDGGPSTIGVARNATGLSNGTRITARYESSTFASEPGNIRLLLYPPGNYNQNEIQLANEGDPDGVLSGTVPRDLPAGTQVRVGAAVWPGEYTIYVTNITATEPPESIDLSLADDAIDNESETSLTVNATLSNGTVTDVTDAAELRSGDETVASVADDGTVTAEGVGTTTLNATYRGESANGTIVVEQNATDPVPDSADFNVDIDENATDDSVGPDGDLQAVATVTNDGDTAATQSIAAIVENETASISAAPTSVSLNRDETATIEFGFNAVDLAPGNYTLFVSSENDSDALPVEVVDSPARFGIVDAEYPDVVEENESLEVNGSITNTGGVEEAQTVGLYVEGELVDETTLTLGPDETESVTLTSDHNGTHSTQLDVYLATEDEEDYRWVVEVYDADELTKPDPENVRWTVGDNRSTSGQEGEQILEQNGTLFTTYPTDDYENSTLVALDPTTGEVIWEQRREGYLTVAGVDDGILIAEGEDTLIGYDPATGDTRWTVESEYIYTAASDAVDRQLAYGTIYADADDRLLGIDVDTGDVTMNVSNLSVRDLHRTHDTVYATESDDRLYALSLDGDVRWSVPLDDYGGEISHANDGTIAVEVGQEVVIYQTGSPGTSARRIHEDDLGGYLSDVTALDDGYLISVDYGNGVGGLTRVNATGEPTHVGNVSGGWVNFHDMDTGLYAVGTEFVRLDASTGEQRWSVDDAIEGYQLNDDRGYLATVRSDEDPVRTAVVYDAVGGTSTDVYGTPHWIAGNTLVDDVAYVTEEGTTRAIQVPALDATDIAFAVSDISVTNESTSGSEAVTVTATVTNTGNRPTVRNVGLDVRTGSEESYFVDSRPVTLDANASTEVTFEGVPIDADATTNSVTISTDRRSETVPVDDTATDRAEFAVTSVNAPASASVDAALTYTADITNTGEANGTQTVSASFADEVVTSRSVTLAPGESRSVAFTATPDSPGVITAAVSTADDDAAATVDVVNQEFVTGYSTGDPHITTFDGVSYDFMAAGDFVLAQEPRGDLLVAARQSPVSDSVSNNNATGTVVGNSSVVIDAEANVPVSIDGEPISITDGETVSVDNGTGEIRRQANTYTVYYAGDDDEVTATDEHLTATVAGDRLDLALSLHPDRENNVEGLLGNVDGNQSNDVAFENGTALDRPLNPDRLYDGFRDDWRVTGDESPFESTYFVETFPESVVTVADLSETERDRAEDALADTCLGPGTPQYEDALIDVALTGDSSYISSACRVSDENVTDGDDASPTTVSVVPDRETVAANETMTVDIRVDTSVNITGSEFVFEYDSAVFAVESVEYGSFLERDGGETTSIQPIVDEGSGSVELGEARQSSDGVSGEGTLATVTLRASADVDEPVSTDLAVADATLTDERNEAVSVRTDSTTVDVTDTLAPDVNATVLTETVYANSTVDVRVNTSQPISDAQLSNATIDADAPVVDREVVGNDSAIYTLEFNESTWNGGSDGDYARTNITATVVTESGGSSTGNAATTVREPGDVTGDGRVDLFDLRFLALAYDSTRGDAEYAADADLTNDGEVGIADLTVLGQNWRTEAWTDDGTTRSTADLAESVSSLRDEPGSDGVSTTETDEVRAIDV